LYQLTLPLGSYTALETKCATVVQP
jgi:hypothetical protein